MDRNNKNEIGVSKVKTILNQLDYKISEAPGLFGRAIVNVDDINVLINKINNELPAELEEARRIIADKEAILARANAIAEGVVNEATAQGEKIVAAAQAESERLVSDTYIAKKAQEKANDMIEQAQREASKAIEYANDFTSNMFNQMVGAVDYFAKEVDEKKKEIYNSLQTEQREYQVGHEDYYSQRLYNGYEADTEKYTNSNVEEYSD